MFTVLSSTNLALPLAEWTVVGSRLKVHRAFSSSRASRRRTTSEFYQVRSPQSLLPVNMFAFMELRFVASQCFWFC